MTSFDDQPGNCTSVSLTFNETLFGLCPGQAANDTFDGSVTAKACVFAADALVEINGQNTTLKQGEVQWTFKAANWSFCSPNNTLSFQARSTEAIKIERFHCLF